MVYVACLCMPVIAHAAEPSAIARAEVEHLLAYLERSQCEFYRNGSWHDAAAARVHLEKKYAYLLNKGLVTRAEDFVELAASTSSVSGKAYQVRCGVSSMPSSRWFNEELRRYRLRRPHESK